MKTGKVIWFNKEKGYGIIRCDEEVSYFAHYSDIESSAKYKVLHENSKVSFSPTQELVHPNVYRAARIRKAA
jgi:cold shock CspA family protein